MTTQTHTVRRGETLSSIAKLYAVEINTLAQYNGIGNIDRISAHQILTIPPLRNRFTPPATSPKPSAHPESVKIVESDFLESLDTALASGKRIAIVGRDAYVAGRGSVEMRVLGLIPVAQASGSALDQGALLRYLNEVLWFPAAALSPFITTWEPVDAHAACATMRFEGATGTATFFFDDAGRPVDMVAERQDLARGRLETWSTPLREYGELEGVRIPVAGQGVWRYDTGDFAYIDLRITSLELDPPSR